MVKKFTKGSALMCSACLSAIDRVEGLVKEETQRPGCIHPWWAVCVKGRVVPDKGQEINDHKAEAGERDLLACKQRGVDGIGHGVPDSAWKCSVVSLHVVRLVEKYQLTP